MRYSSAEAVRPQIETVRSKVCVRILGGEGGLGNVSAKTKATKKKIHVSPTRIGGL